MKLTILNDQNGDYSSKRYVSKSGYQEDHVVFHKYKDDIDVIGFKFRGGSTSGTANSGILEDLKRLKFLLNSIEELN